MHAKRFHFTKWIAISLFIVILIMGCISSLGFNRRVYGSGNVIKEGRDVQNFTEVVLSEEGDLFIDFGEQEQLIIEAEDNLQKYLIAEVQDGVLDIKKLPENVTLHATKPLRYHLILRELKTLTIKNSGDAKVTEVNTDNFSIRITGSGSVHINTLNVHRLDMGLTSSGNLLIDEGRADEQIIRLSSSGEYDGENVICQNAYVKLTSSGNATLNVLEDLEADLSSSGDVYYIGNPKIVYTDSSSSGRVQPLQ